MNFGSGVQNISFPGESPVYIRPVFTKNPIEPVQRFKPEESYFHKPENLEEFLQNSSSAIDSSLSNQRGRILDIKV